ncbi:MSP domain-containing protein [Schizosaccharomyces cryophilus OY26]|uniref:MSP domain-containing protein n=1 Tax=Schizosaccharomyces cryophilus (strain OY26 / ATCC MYA-4695 / CBS 11777 / NBRC 106824 / NRRL Y48691) TaxID=653667 RepID=S9W0G9_SCHCR|nr:MSP domain-containing protein [Schizosaccharomyces cryophilus OY26]EPY51904.1 MSP domain-containing protein [Schizosaccharomyces cryophilus OY26]
MSIECRNSIFFPRPLTQLVKRDFQLDNPSSVPIGFKVKTTAPKQYCVRPNGGRIEPNSSTTIQVILQPLDHEPAPNTKCRDKFLVQSAELRPELEGIDTTEIWSQVRKEDVHERKIRCVFGDPSEEETSQHNRHKNSISSTTSNAAFASQAPNAAYGRQGQPSANAASPTLTQPPQMPRSSVDAPATPRVAGKAAPPISTDDPVATAPNVTFPSPSAPTSNPINPRFQSAAATSPAATSPPEPKSTHFGTSNTTPLPATKSTSTFGRPTSGAKVVPQIHNTVTVQTAVLLAVICFLIGLLF